MEESSVQPPAETVAPPANQMEPTAETVEMTVNPRNFEKLVPPSRRQLAWTWGLAQLDEIQSGESPASGRH